MIGAGGVITGLAALKRQDSVRSQHHPQAPPPGAGSAHSRKRKPRSDVVVVRGKLRLYSAAGFFLVLGVLILMAGVAMAVLGYWPHNRPLPAGPAPGPAPRVKAAPDGSSVTSGDPGVTPPKPRGGVLARFLERHLHSERMRMLGPFTMGIGIFIFICANAILHENRDRETKVIHMRDMYSTVIDLHSLHLQEHKHMNGAFGGGGPQRPGPLYPGPCYADHDPAAASRLAAHTLLTFAGLGAEGRSRCGSLRAISVEEEEEEEEGLLGEAKGGCGLLSPGYRDRSGSVFGFRPVGGRPWEGEAGGARCQTRSIVSSSISAFTLPVIKLNNCVIDASDMDDITAEGEGPAAPAAAERERSWPFPTATAAALSLAVPGPPAPPPKAHKPPGLVLLRSNSASESHSSSSFSPGAVSSSGRYLSPGAAARKDFGSNGSLHMLSAHSKSLDLERGGGVGGGGGGSSLTVSPEQRRHPSWPRLDRSGSKGYMRLEDREDPPVDRLLLPPPPVAGRRDYTKREKLLMISRSHNNLSFERHDDNVVAGGNLKRGTSETRF